MSAAEEHWQVLQMSDVLDVEFAKALAETGPVTLWKPSRSFLPLRPFFQEGPQSLPGSTMQIRSFPILRGFARPRLRLLARTGSTLTARLKERARQPERDVLVCTTPHFAAVAERWPGPVVYWLTDMIAEYEGVDPASHRELDRRMCEAADLVCPNSARIAAYLREEAGCPEDKIQLLPNATRSRNILPAPLMAPTALPAPADAAARPVAGVLGTLAGNMDWVFLEKLLALTPWLSWVFVGPTDLPIREPDQRRAREAVMGHHAALFTGASPYGELYRYARGFSVAVLPYRHREPTFSGSSTRFYEHLAACHPMIATQGVAELLSKEPLLRLVDSPEQAARALEALRAAGFDDGLRNARWEASQQNTWRDRATAMRAALARRLGRSVTEMPAGSPEQEHLLQSTTEAEAS